MKKMKYHNTPLNCYCTPVWEISPIWPDVLQGDGLLGVANAYFNYANKRGLLLGAYGPVGGISQTVVLEKLIGAIR